MPAVVDCTIVEHEQVAEGHYRMSLRSPAIADDANPGQFCMIQVEAGLHPFLRRPMSLHSIGDGEFSILYKIEGEGTRILSRLCVSQKVSVQGPLGNGFPIIESSRTIIVSGGIGVAPLPALAARHVRDDDNAPDVVLAARTADLLLCQDDFRKLGCLLHIATDDGSAGQQALADDMLRDLQPNADTVIYACGPMPMMRAISKVAMETGAKCFVCLEAQMACGDGACLGCVVESNREQEGEKMVRVCKDGPVFDASIIDWGAHDTDYDR